MDLKQKEEAEEIHTSIRVALYKYYTDLIPIVIFSFLKGRLRNYLGSIKPAICCSYSQLDSLVFSRTRKTPQFLIFLKKPSSKVLEPFPQFLRGLI